MKLATDQPWRTLLKGMLLGIAITGIIQIPFFVLALLMGIEPKKLFADEFAQFFNIIGWALQLIVAAVCGLHRSGSYHPINNPKYRAFLETSPWNHRKPLPFGPVHLLLSDWIVLLGWTGVVAALLRGNPLYLPMVFLTAYLLGTLGPLSKTEQRAAGLIIGFGLAAVVRFWQHPIASTALLLALYATAYLGLLQSLKSFPWPKKPKPLVLSFGWPLDYIGPKRNEVQTSFGRAFIVASLVAAWVHAVMSHIREMQKPADEPGVVVIMAGIAIFTAFIRWVTYINGYASPLNLRGRFWTGRWIIWRHDGPLATSMMLPFIAVATQLALYSMNLKLMDSVPLGFGVLLLAAMTLPPNRRRWQLTGEHRMTFVAKTNQVTTES